MTVAFWFRRDFRLFDNPALFYSAKKGTILAFYLLDPEQFALMGQASQWALFQSLQYLNSALEGKLNVYQGSFQLLFQSLSQDHGIRDIFWNKCYEPFFLSQDQTVIQWMEKESLQSHLYHDHTLWEPHQLLKSDGTPYRVFAPFYTQKCLTLPPPREPLASPPLDLMKDPHSCSLQGLKETFLPYQSWHKKMASHWTLNEGTAQEKLSNFVEKKLESYETLRNYPSSYATSSLSSFLHWGQISSPQVWHRVSKDKDSSFFLRELIWRDFSILLLMHYPTLPTEPLQKRFSSFPFIYNETLFNAWKKGQTGHPFVDAGMRQLWQTGTMHNRLRMITASFLVKNLLISWKDGFQWFWDCLVDADQANNSMNWQWIAGSGTDTGPYHRIFNPLLQGEKWDKEGTYTRHFVPELSQLPNTFLFKPWQAPQEILHKAGVVLGKTYPLPIVDLKVSRQKALNAYYSLF